ncbi:MAG: hypothetical protein QOF96_3441 [Actinomycetota bacterium]|nr:hypothetical protein [Actinomycetota bacterium]
MYTLRKTLISAGLVGTTLVGGAVGAALLTGTANAAESTSSTAASSAAADSSGTTSTSDSGKAARPAETPLTGDPADKVKAAALAAVPGGTVDRVETDSDGSPYEAHVTKADGSQVTVKVDANYAVTSIDTDSGGKGGRGHGGGSGGPHTANGITETPLTGDAADKAKAAALAAVPGATVDRAETDADGAANEVHMTKADGSHVTVELDANFNVTSVGNG